MDHSEQKNGFHNCPITNATQSGKGMTRAENQLWRGCCSLISQSGVSHFIDRFRGLKQLAEVCLALAELPEDNEEAKRLGNHYHFADYMNNLEDGSTEFIILYKPNL